MSKEIKTIINGLDTLTRIKPAASKNTIAVEFGLNIVDPVKGMVTITFGDEGIAVDLWKIDQKGKAECCGSMYEFIHEFQIIE